MRLTLIFLYHAVQVHRKYVALSTFNAYCYQPRNMLELRMNAGTA